MPFDPRLDPVRLRARGYSGKANPVWGWVSLGAVIVLWQVAALVQDNFIFLPRPADVLTAALSLAATGELARHVTASLTRLAMGWGLGVAVGFALGLMMGLDARVRAAALPLVSALFALPKIALLPLFIIWFGIGEGAKVLTIAAGVFSPIALATCGGLDSVDRRLIRMAQSFDLPAWRIVTAVLLPGAMPVILTGLRLSTSIAIVLLTGAEMLAAQYGLGALALNAGGLMRTDNLFVALALLAALGVAFSGLVGLCERILLQWR